MIKHIFEIALVALIMGGCVSEKISDRYLAEEVASLQNVGLYDVTIQNRKDTANSVEYEAIVNKKILHCKIPIGFFVNLDDFSHDFSDDPSASDKLKAECITDGQ